MSDELLQSFIFRVLSRNGYKKECSSVVSKIGWNSKPKLPQSCSWLFSNKMQPNLAAFFAKSLGERYTGNIFDNPLLALYNFKKLFNYEVKNPSYGLSIKIHFCEKCFQEQYAEYGFTYFRRSWILNEVCERHLQTLEIFQASREVSSYEFVSSPLVTLNIDRDDDSFIDEYRISTDSNFTNIAEQSKFALCAKRTFTNNLLNFLYIFRYDFFNKHGENEYRLAKSIDTFSLTSGKLDAQYDEVLLEYHSKLRKKSSDFLDRNIMYGLEQVSFKYKDNELGEYTTLIMKDKDYRCSSCRRCYKVAKKFNPACSIEII